MGPRSKTGCFFFGCVLISMGGVAGFFGTGFSAGAGFFCTGFSAFFSGAFSGVGFSAFFSGAFSACFSGTFSAFFSGFGRSAAVAK